MKTIKSKLVVWNFLVIVAALIIFQASVYFLVKQILYDEIDDELAIECRETAEMLVRSESLEAFTHISKWEEYEHTRVYDHAVYIQIARADGTVWLQSHNLEKTGLVLPVDFEGPDVVHRDFSIDNRPFRFAGLVVEKDDAPIAILSLIHPLDNFENAISQFLWTFLIVSPFCVGAALSGIWLIARRSLTPLARITTTAENIIESGNPDHRIEKSEADVELKELTDTLNHMFETLHASFERTKSFTGAASHELRTPLTAMRGHIEVTLSRARTDAEYRDVLRSVLDEVIKMSQITDNLLFLARADSQPSRLPMTIVRLDKLIDENLKTLLPLCEPKNLTCTTRIDGEIEVVGNKNLLIQLLTNLIGNAVKYNRENGSIEIALSRQNGKAVLEIADSGIGIPEEEIGRIFERFYRVDKTRSRAFGGSGLGLSIVDWIIREHNGTITVVSELHRGSRFITELPIAQIDASTLG